MKVDELITAIRKEKTVSKDQPLGIIKSGNPSDEYWECSILFTAGKFDNLQLYPINMECPTLPPPVSINFSDRLPCYIPCHEDEYFFESKEQHRKLKEQKQLPSSYLLNGEIDTIYSSKKDFKTEMEKIIEKFEENKKKRFPLFVRDISRLGWKY